MCLFRGRVRYYERACSPTMQRCFSGRSCDLGTHARSSRRRIRRSSDEGTEYRRACEACPAERHGHDSEDRLHGGVDATTTRLPCPASVGATSATTCEGRSLIPTRLKSPRRGGGRYPTSQDRLFGTPNTQHRWRDTFRPDRPDACLNQRVGRIVECASSKVQRQQRGRPQLSGMIAAHRNCLLKLSSTCGSFVVQ